MGGGRWKSQHRKIVYPSPHFNFNSKVIKSFVSELRSVFYVSGFLRYLYKSYEHSMSISHIRIMGMLQSVKEEHFFLQSCLQKTNGLDGHDWLENTPTASLQMGKRPTPNEYTGYDTNNLIVRLQWCWFFGKYKVSLYCHRFQVNSGLKWIHLIGSYQWVLC